MRRIRDQRNGFIRRLKRKVGNTGLDAFLLVDEKDIQYLTGFYSAGAKLLVPAGKKPVYFIDTMNYNLCSTKLSKSGVGEIIQGRVMDSLKHYIKANKIRKIGLNERSISAFEYRRLLSGIRCRLVHLPLLMESLRQIKIGDEIKTIRKAAGKTVKIWKEVKKNIEPGMSEKDIRDMVDVLVRALGFENSFPTIVATGTNTAYPHAIAGGKRFKSGQHLLVDLGILLDGYCSDLTRTYSKGRINRKIADFGKLVLQAQDKAIKAIKPGVAICSVVRAVNDFFINNNAGEFVLHGLGHGIGLNVHERPLLRADNTERFRKGMVITVEPGLYMPGLGGVRHEDMVLVTSKGCEVLTK
ncbi:MAG: M24 family metallopeptidase [Candidatus Omnitrophica bacterium]|nr:M24 family metallopeptidase [Candidatus Omnitrophota bacterium]